MFQVLVLIGLIPIYLPDVSRLFASSVCLRSFSVFVSCGGDGAFLKAIIAEGLVVAVYRK